MTHPPYIDLLRGFRGSVRWNQALAPLTSWRIGGPADCMVFPADPEALAELLRSLHRSYLPWIVLGKGTNLLFADSGFRGVVIRLGSPFGAVRMDGEELVAGAGIALTKLVRFAVSRSVAGVELLIGIPGSFGGAIWCNAGAHGLSCLDRIVMIEGVTRSGECFRTSSFTKAYRSAPLEDGHIVTGARLRVSPGDPHALRVSMRDCLNTRRSSQPLTQKTAGCTFRNPKEAGAGLLIDRAGLKGLRHGGACVSTLHANFLINDGNATAADMIALMRTIQRTVFQNHSILLKPEVHIVNETGERVEVTP